MTDYSLFREICIRISVGVFLAFTGGILMLTGYRDVRGAPSCSGGFVEPCVLGQPLVEWLGWDSRRVVVLLLQ